MHFFSIDKVFDIIQRQIFKYKCCNSLQCKNNIQDTLFKTHETMLFTKSRNIKPRSVSRTDNVSIKKKELNYNPYRKVR
jgi:hypothetical protein